MFDIGFTELLLIAVVALIVLGPERLPNAARFAGLWVRRARAQWHSVKAELERTLAEILGPAYQPRTGTRLVVTIGSIWLASYAGGSKWSDGGSSNDTLESTATLYDRKGRQLASYPIRSTETSGGAGAWYPHRYPGMPFPVGGWMHRPNGLVGPGGLVPPVPFPGPGAAGNFNPGFGGGGFVWSRR